MSEQQDPYIGKVFDGKYEILELIGRGAMGSVYKARHQLMDRLVAIKLLQVAKFQGDELEEYLKRFEREAKTTSRIEHPNAITIHDYGVENQLPYLVMQYVDGKTLRQAMAEAGNLPFRRIIRIAQQVAGALAAAHKLGVVHRDLKPDNIMLRANERGEDLVDVLDFGIAKVLSGEATTTVTQAGEAVGTPQYISPEQAKAEDVGPAADIYSLAVIVYEMLAGRSPFKADTAMSMLYKHVHEEPPPLRDVNPDVTVPEAAETLLFQALAKKPSERPQDARTFVAKLSDALLEQKSAAISESGSEEAIATEELTVTPSVSRFTLPILGVACVLLLVCIGAYARMSTFAPQQKRAVPADRAEQLFAAAPGSARVIRSGPQLRKGDIAGQLAKAEQLLEEGSLIAAEHIAQDVLAVDRNNAAGHFLMGKIFARRRIPRKAMFHLRRARELEPDNSEYQDSVVRLEKKFAEFMRKKQQRFRNRPNGRRSGP